MVIDGLFQSPFFWLVLDAAVEDVMTGISRFLICATFQSKKLLTTRIY